MAVIVMPKFAGSLAAARAEFELALKGLAHIDGDLPSSSSFGVSDANNSSDLLAVAIDAEGLVRRMRAAAERIHEIEKAHAIENQKIKVADKTAYTAFDSLRRQWGVTQFGRVTL